jgi:hypothetical protein
MLHRYFKEYRHETEYPFGGHSEMFDIPLDDAVEAYERVLNGEDLDKETYEPKGEHEADTDG